MKRKTQLTGILAAGLLVIFTYACSQGQQSSEAVSKEAVSSGETPSVEAAATVNGQAIPMSELQTAVRNVVMQNGMDPGNIEAFMGQFGPRILDQLIDGELLLQAARDSRHAASEEDITRAFTELSGQYETPEAFQAEMEKRGFTEQTLKESINKQLSIQKFIQETIVPEAEVPEAMLREAYDQNPQNFAQSEEVKASHILINSAENDPQEKRDEALKKAREIAASARKEGADFAELARQHSEGPSAPSGGDLGFFSRGRMVKPFEEAAFSMKVDEISEPVLTRFGYHIIKVTDRREAKTIPFEEVKDRLTQDLKNRMINEMIGQKLTILREKADIRVLFASSPQTAPGGATPAQPVR